MTTTTATTTGQAARTTAPTTGQAARTTAPRHAGREYVPECPDALAASYKGRHVAR